jgi:hypothetical protein
VELLASIESIVGSDGTKELILSWSRGFREDEFTVEDIQDCFASLDLSGTDLPHAAQKRIREAQRELDAIQWGMCEAGQRAEIKRIFAELDRLLADHKMIRVTCIWEHSERWSCGAVLPLARPWKRTRGRVALDELQAHQRETA